MSRFFSPVGGRTSGPRHPFARAGCLVAAAVVLTVSCGVLTPAAVLAHGAPTKLDFWGAFGRRVARCQRIISRSAAVCASRAWTTRQACMLADMRGDPCDHAAAKSAVEAAHVATVNAISVACTEQQVLTLVFSGQYEAESDAVTFCRELETAATSAVFLPVPATPSAATPQIRACVESTALATTKLLHSAFESRQLLLDRIAQKPFSRMQKLAMLATSDTAISRAAAALEGLVSDGCPADVFTEIYGRDPASFFALIASRADCLAGQTYAQGGVLCPASQCGNGMIERAEDCDDGNRVDGDGCSARCTFEEPAVQAVQRYVR